MEPSKTYFTIGLQVSSAGLTKLNASSIISSGNVLSFTASIPVEGWSSSVQTSDSADTRVVALATSGFSNISLTANVTNIPFTAIKDTHGAWNGTVYTVPVSGDYTITSSLGYTTSNETYPQVFIDGVFAYALGWSTGSRIMTSSVLATNLKAGQQISLRGAHTAINGFSSYGLFINRLSGPSAIAASETVAASYWCSVNTATTAANPINYDVKDYDTHSAVTTGAAWKFTVPISGKYFVSGVFYINAGGNSGFSLYKNGVRVRIMGIATSASNQDSMPFSVTTNLIAGDTIDIRPTGNVTNVGVVSGTLIASHIQITRTGN